jgi:hypothetical protein
MAEPPGHGMLAELVDHTPADDLRNRGTTARSG